MSDYAHVVGASYVGDPKSNTVMFVTRKVGYLIADLSRVEGCLVFVETGIDVSADIKTRHEIIFTDNPQLQYARFVQRFINREDALDSEFPPQLTEGGYYLSLAVSLGEGVRIEPGVLVFGDSSIGDNVEIHAGAVIRHASIGAGSIVKSGACIGDQSFNFAKDEKGNSVRIPSVGRVHIGKNVEVGCCTTVCRGMAGNTVVSDYAKLDDHVHVAHDVFIGSNTEVTGKVAISGYCHVGCNCFLGAGSVLRNRIAIGDGAFIGMGSAVMRNVKPGAKVAGNPAKRIDWE